MTPSPVRVARQHRLRGRARRQQHAYYMKHRSAIKRRSKQRYRRVRHTSQHRRHQHLYSQHPERFHRIGAAAVAIPFYSPTLGPGVVTGVEGPTVYYQARCPGTLDWADFTKDATFLAEDGVDEFFALLDDEIGSPFWGLDECGEPAPGA